MKKASFFLLLLLIGLYTSAQTGERILISGTIEVPLGDDPQGTSIFNLNSNRFTVTDSLGKFNIAVAFKDSLRISSLQFQEFTVIVDQGIINTKTLTIFVSEMVSRLPEVVVTPYDLSGNINVDLNRLKTAKLPTNLTAENVQNMDFYTETGPDLSSHPYNTALAMSKTRLVNGLDFVNIFKEILIAKKREDVKNPYGKSVDPEIDDYIRKIYEDDFFRENLDIKREYIRDFIFYANDNGLSEQMLKGGNELDLIDFLIEQSKKYKKQFNRK
jgi:hypothetical protein